MSEYSFVLGGLLPTGGAGGLSRLRGTVLDKTGAPISKNVSVFMQKTKTVGAPWNSDLTLLNVVVSSVETGQWEVPYLPGDYLFTVIAYDDAGEYDPVAKVDLIPEPME